MTPLPVGVFTDVQVQFTAMISGRREKTLVDAQVVRCEASGVAVEWREFAPDAVRALVMVPPFRAADAAPLQSEQQPPEHRSRFRQHHS